MDTNTCVPMFFDGSLQENTMQSSDLLGEKVHQFDYLNIQICHQLWKLKSHILLTFLIITGSHFDIFMQACALWWACVWGGIILTLLCAVDQ